jgi:poly-gamma-glutamate capsule biosynthesis protein CapA/YwtB (metallophosphatase superfamily)
VTTDWHTGTWRTEGAAGEPTARLTVASDWGPRGLAYEPHLLARPEGIYGDLLPLLRGSDLNVANVESVLGTAGAPILKGGPNLRGDERTVRALTVVPFHVACLANNHALDYGPEGLAHTLSVLQAAGLRTVGAALTGEEAAQTLTVRAGDVRVGVIDCAEGEEARSRDGGPGVNGLDVPRIERQLAALKREADLVLVVFHGGREYTPVPPPYVVRDLRQLADAGADAIVAHHPHVPQGIEVHNGVPIAYSLGNFVFWQGSDCFYQRAGYLFHLDLVGTKVAGFTISPYLLQPDGLALMQGQVKEAFLQDLACISEVLHDPQAVLAVWDAFIEYTGGAEGYWRSLIPHIEGLVTDPAQHAPGLLNRLVTPAHRELYVRSLRRLLEHEPPSPCWARELVARWRTRRLDEVLPETL